MDGVLFHHKIKRGKKAGLEARNDLDRLVNINPFDGERIKYSLLNNILIVKNISKWNGQHACFGQLSNQNYNSSSLPVCDNKYDNNTQLEGNILNSDHNFKIERTIESSVPANIFCDFNLILPAVELTE